MGRLIAAALLLVGCAAQSGDDGEHLPRSGVPVLAGAWQRMPQAPLTARGDALAVWTGSRLLLLGGAHTDAEYPPCPPAAACAAPASTELQDGAAWDPGTGAWTHLRAAGTRPLRSGDPAAWSGTQALTRSVAITPDLVAGTLTTAPLDLGEALVYADPVWTGTRLVGIDRDYGARESGVDGQLVAEVLDPRTGDQRSVPWPFDPPGGAETARTAWTGREVVALVDAEVPGARTTRVVAFDPAAGTWRQVRDPVPPPSSMAWDGRAVQVATAGGDLLSIDPASGATTTTALPDRASGTLLASPGGRLLLHGQREYLRTNAPGQDPGGAPAPRQGWRRLPALPSTVRTQSRTVAWGGEQLVVWGGRGSGVEGEGTVNTAEGWTFTATPRDPGT